MKKVLYIYVISLFLLTNSSCSDRDSNEPSKFGWIEGQIIDFNTRLGIGEVELTLTNETEYTPVKRDITDSEGNFKFDRLDRGIYKLYISKKGYQTDSIYPIEVISNQPSKANKSIYVKTISIQGIIKSGDASLENAYAYLIPIGNKGTKVEVDHGTSVDGKFVFSNLPDGEKYNLLVFKDGYQSITDREITVPDENANVIMEVKTAGSISFDKVFVDMGEFSDIAVLGINTGADQSLSWELTSDAKWISFDTVRGKGNNSTIVNIDRNYLSGKNNECSTKIIVKASDGKYDELWVIVSGAGKGVNIGDILTLSPKEVTSNSAVLSGVFLNEDLKAAVKQIGLCYSSVNTNPVYEKDESVSTSLASMDDDGVYTVTVTGLAAGTVYYARAYAINKVTNKFHYSPNVRNFITPSTQPSVNVESITEITAVAAKFHAEILHPGEPSYIECGFVYATIKEPTIESAINKLSVSKIYDNKYEFDIQGLVPNQEYHVRAYAVNASGVFYSNDYSFTTGKREVQLLTSNVTEIGSSSATFNGDIIEVGIPAYNERGFCYSKNSNPIITDSKIIASGFENGNFFINISGLDRETTYYARAYAKQGTDIIYGNEVKFKTIWIPTIIATSMVTNVEANAATLNGIIRNIGEPGYSEYGFVYSNLNKTPTLGDIKIPLTGYAQSFSKTITTLMSNQTYFVRSYAIQPDDINPIYGETKEFTTGTPPQVQTFQVTEVDKLNQINGTYLLFATLKGNVVYPGSPCYIERGFVYKEEDFAQNTPPVYDKDIVLKHPTTEPDDFQTVTQQLDCFTWYVVRAYVKTASGVIYYGDRMNFDTWNPKVY